MNALTSFDRDLERNATDAMFAAALNDDELSAIDEAKRLDAIINSTIERLQDLAKVKSHLIGMDDSELSDALDALEAAKDTGLSRIIQDLEWGDREI